MQTGHYIYVSRSTAFDVKVIHQLHVMLEAGLQKHKLDFTKMMQRAQWIEHFGGGEA